MGTAMRELGGALNRRRLATVKEKRRGRMPYFPFYYGSTYIFAWSETTCAWATIDSPTFLPLPLFTC